MQRVIMLVGLPGSGKSTYAKNLIQDENLKLNFNWKLCSSDRTRLKLYGDEKIQGNPQTVFTHLHKEVEKALLDGYNVIYDATNVNRKSRKTLLQLTQKFDNVVTECHIIWSPYEVCIERDSQRDRTVGEEVIKKMLFRWESPFFDEGFSVIEFINTAENFDPVEYSNSMLEKMKISHENPHHCLDVLDHCTAVYEDILKDKGETYLAHAGMWHDIGKPMTKFFKTDESGKKETTAHYYNHDNVGGYLVYGCYGTVDEFYAAITVSWLVSNHMQPFFNSKYYRNLDEKLKKYIDRIHKADIEHP